jgi:hypothetical protein
MAIGIPKDQLCEAFDPMMVLPEKKHGMSFEGRTNSSCVAPAYVYLEGPRGKRFLCDFHYYYEQTITEGRSPQQWKEVCETVIDERNRIKETFEKINYSKTTFDAPCWCESKAFVKLTYSDPTAPLRYLCNFHYRKMLYRHLSNGLKVSDEATVLDERFLMEETVIEQAERVKKV